MTIDFSGAAVRPIVASSTGAEQARAGVQLYDPVTDQSLSPVTDCVVDTGSQYTVLPRRMLTAAGLVPGRKQVSVRTVAGTVVTFDSRQVQLLIEGQYHIPATVLVCGAKAFTPVLGLADAKNTFDFGFDFTNWYFDQ